jgi:hypothetical protein
VNSVQKAGIMLQDKCKWKWWKIGKICAKNQMLCWSGTG